MNGSIFTLERGKIIRLHRDEYLSFKRNTATQSLATPIVSWVIAFAALFILWAQNRSAITPLKVDRENYSLIITLFALSLSLLIPIDRAVKDREKRLIISLKQRSPRLTRNIYNLEAWYQFSRIISILVSFFINLFSASQIWVLIADQKATVGQILLATIAFLIAAVVDRTYFNIDWPEELESIDGFSAAREQIHKKAPGWLKKKFEEVTDLQIRQSIELFRHSQRLSFPHKLSSSIAAGYTTIPCFSLLIGMAFNNYLNEKSIFVFRILFSFQALLAFLLSFLLGELFAMVTSRQVSSLSRSYQRENWFYYDLCSLFGFVLFMAQFSVSTAAVSKIPLVPAFIVFGYFFIGLALISFLLYSCTRNAVDKLIERINTIRWIENRSLNSLRTDLTAKEIEAILELILTVRKQGEFVLPNE